MCLTWDDDGDAKEEKRRRVETEDKAAPGAEEVLRPVNGQAGVRARWGRRQRSLPNQAERRPGR